MGGPRKQSTKGQSTKGHKKPNTQIAQTAQTTDLPSEGEQQQLKQEPDSDEAVHLPPVAGPSNYDLVPMSQLSQTAAGLSTPGHVASSSPIPASSSPGQMVLPPGRKKNGAKILWNYTDTPVPYQGGKNGRQSGRNLIQWGRPRMYEKLILHLQYEMNRHNTPIPWDFVAHRFHPGSSGQAILQHLNRIRPLMLAEGHLLPPLCQKAGSKKAFPREIRGYMRAFPDSDDCVSARAVLWSEPVFDSQHNLPNVNIDKSIKGSVKRFQMGGKYLFPNRKNPLKRNTDDASLAGSESAKKARQSSSKASSVANDVEQAEEPDLEEDQQDHIPEQWVCNQDTDGYYAESLSSPSHRASVLAYDEQDRYIDDTIQDEDEEEEMDLQRAIKESLNDYSSTMHRYNIPQEAVSPIRAPSSSFGQQPAVPVLQGQSPANPDPASTNHISLSDDAAEAAFWKQQYFLLLEEKNAGEASHHYRVAQTLTESKNRGIVAGFNMARQNPHLSHPPLHMFENTQFSSPVAGNLMRSVHSIPSIHGTTPTCSANQAPSTPMNNSAALPSFPAAVYGSPTPGTNSFIPIHPALLSRSSPMTSAMANNLDYGRNSAMLSEPITGFPPVVFQKQAGYTASGSNHMFPYNNNTMPSNNPMASDETKFQMFNSETAHNGSSLPTRAVATSSRLTGAQGSYFDSANHNFKAGFDNHTVNHNVGTGMGMMLPQSAGGQVAGNYFMHAVAPLSRPSAAADPVEALYQDNPYGDMTFKQ